MQCSVVFYEEVLIWSLV